MQTEKKIEIMRDVPIPMRDGVELLATVFLPATGTMHPVVLARTAYNRLNLAGWQWAVKGYAAVVQDCRGRYGSGGEWYPFVHEAHDGFDTLEWIGRQPWCNGRVGMYGDSYLAATQFLVVPEGSQYLQALNPRHMAGDCWKRAYYCDGAFSLALTWSWLCFECSSSTSNAALMPLYDLEELFRTLPLLSLDQASGREVQSYRDYLRHCSYDDFWQNLNIRDKGHQFTMPVLLTGGWYDYYAGETFSNYLALIRSAPTLALRASHRVLVGPWTHGIPSSSKLGQLDFGPQALTENDATERWLDCILQGRDPESFQKAPIRIFVMGINQWRDEYEWPLKRTRFTNYYFHSAGRANSILGDGTLSLEQPGAELPDRYTYNPENPVPSLGGNHSIGRWNPRLYDILQPGPFDQRPIERRDDVLVYTLPPLQEDVEVTGPVVVKLVAASSEVDTDFVARLLDVYPDGRSINITEGILRARFRKSVWDQPELIEPGVPLEYTIDLQATSNVFRRGHRIRVDITSSGFPLWDRNLNTGEDPGTGTGFRVAEQTVFHDSSRRSYVRLPIIPRSGNTGT